jgi:hypothetical protein
MLLARNVCDAWAVVVEYHSSWRRWHQRYGIFAGTSCDALILPSQHYSSNSTLTSLRGVDSLIQLEERGATINLISTFEGLHSILVWIVELDDLACNLPRILRLGTLQRRNNSKGNNIKHNTQGPMTTNLSKTVHHR